MSVIQLSGTQLLLEEKKKLTVCRCREIYNNNEQSCIFLYVQSHIPLHIYSVCAGANSGVGRGGYPPLIVILVWIVRLTHSTYYLFMNGLGA